jgi:hypothetical protein
MVNPEYPTFESWYNETEIYSFRSDRFFEHLDLFNSTVCTDQRNEFITNWMRAAFESARLEKGNSL